MNHQQIKKDKVSSQANIWRHEISSRKKICEPRTKLVDNQFVGEIIKK